MKAIWIAGFAGTVAHAIEADATVVDGWAPTLCRPRGRLRLAPARLADLPQCRTCAGALARECGTYAGYIHHKKVNEEPCRPCLDASAEYVRNLRARNPRARQKNNKENAARSRALWRLARIYPRRFERLFAEEMGR